MRRSLALRCPNVTPDVIQLPGTPLPARPLPTVLKSLRRSRAHGSGDVAATSSVDFTCAAASAGGCAKTNCTFCRVAHFPTSHTSGNLDIAVAVTVLSDTAKALGASVPTGAATSQVCPSISTAICQSTSTETTHPTFNGKDAYLTDTAAIDGSDAIAYDELVRCVFAATTAQRATAAVSQQKLAQVITSTSLSFSAVLSAISCAAGLRLSPELQRALVGKWRRDIGTGSVLLHVDVAQAFVHFCVRTSYHSLFATLLMDFIVRPEGGGAPEGRRSADLASTEFVLRLLCFWLQLPQEETAIPHLFIALVETFAKGSQRDDSLLGASAAPTFEETFPELSRRLISELVDHRGLRDIMLSESSGENYDSTEDDALKLQSGPEGSSASQEAASLLESLVKLGVLEQLPTLAMTLLLGGGDGGGGSAAEPSSDVMPTTVLSRLYRLFPLAASNVKPATVAFALQIAVLNLLKPLKWQPDTRLTQHAAWVPFWSAVVNKCATEEFWTSNWATRSFWSHVGDETAAAVRSVAAIAVTLSAAPNGPSKRTCAAFVAALASAISSRGVPAAVNLLFDLERCASHAGGPAGADAMLAKGIASAVLDKLLGEGKANGSQTSSNQSTPAAALLLAEVTATLPHFIPCLALVCIKHEVNGVDLLLDILSSEALAVLIIDLDTPAATAAGAAVSSLGSAAQVAQLRSRCLRLLIAKCARQQHKLRGDAPSLQQQFERQLMRLCVAAMRDGLDPLPLLAVQLSSVVVDHLRVLSSGDLSDATNAPPGVSAEERQRLQVVMVELLMQRLRHFVVLNAEEQSSNSGTAVDSSAPTTGTTTTMTIADVAAMGKLLFGQKESIAKVRSKTKSTLLQAAEEHFTISKTKIRSGKRLLDRKTGRISVIQDVDTGGDATVAEVGYKKMTILPHERNPADDDEIEDDDVSTSRAGLPKAICELHGPEYIELLVLLCRDPASDVIIDDDLPRVIRAFPLPSPHQLFENSLLLCVNCATSATKPDEAPPGLNRMIEKIELLFPHGALGIFKGVALRARSPAALTLLLDAMIKQYMLPSVPVAQRLRSVGRMRKLLSKLTKRGKLTEETALRLSRTCWLEFIFSLLSVYNVVMSTLLGFLFVTMYLKISPEASVVRWRTLHTLVPHDFTLSFDVDLGDGEVASVTDGFSLIARSADELEQECDEGSISDGKCHPDTQLRDEVVLGRQEAQALQHFAGAACGQVGLAVVTLNTRRATELLGTVDRPQDGNPAAGLLSFIPGCVAGARNPVALKLRTTAVDDFVSDAAWAFRLSTRASAATKPLHWYFSMVSLSSPLTRRMLFDAMQDTTYFVEVPEDMLVTPSLLADLRAAVAGSGSRCILVGSNASFVRCGGSLVGGDFAIGAMSPVITATAPSRSLTSPLSAAVALVASGGRRVNSPDGAKQPHRSHYPSLIGDVTQVVVTAVEASLTLDQLQKWQRLVRSRFQKCDAARMGPLGFDTFFGLGVRGDPRAAGTGHRVFTLPPSLAGEGREPEPHRVAPFALRFIPPRASDEGPLSTECVGRVVRDAVRRFAALQGEWIATPAAALPTLASHPLALFFGPLSVQKTLSLSSNDALLAVTRQSVSKIIDQLVPSVAIN